MAGKKTKSFPDMVINIRMAEEIMITIIDQDVGEDGTMSSD